MRLPIRVRMTAWYVALLALVLIAVGAFLVVQLRADLTAGIDRNLRAAVRQVAADYRAEGAGELHDSAQTVLGGERVVTQVLGPYGNVLAWAGDPLAERPLTTAPRPLATVRLEGQRFRLASRRVGDDVVVVGESLAPVERSANRLLTLLLIACPVALLAIATGGWSLARRALRPIAQITTTAEQIGVDRLGARVDVPPTRDEVAHLAATLNTMLERIQHGVEEQHRLVADASHELRTPLAAMRAELDVSLDADELSPDARAVLESTREEVDRLSRTVEDLLTLAVADEGGLEIVPEVVDLHDVAVAVVAQLAPLGAVELAGGPALVTGDALRLRHAIRNLVANAIEFGSHVEVRTWSRGAEAGVTVTDDGPGIPADARDRVFDRFYRVDASRTRATGGSGLGLAIVREVALAHGGRAWVEPEGSAVSLALPVAAHAPEPAAS